MPVDLENSEKTNEQNFIYRLGAFEIHPQTKLLLKNKCEIAIEPKVFDVLYYLCKNAGDYVQIDDLHENIWAGRVVSDAAVRRTISKLRNILDCDQTQYIKSVHKKGYKIILDVVRLDESYISPPTENSNISSRIKFPRFSFTWILGLTIVLFIVVWQIFDLYSEHYYEEKIILIPGDKTHAIIDSENSMIAFAGKVMGLQGFQLFLTELETNDTKQITQNENNVVRVRLGPDSKLIYFVDMMLGNTKIKSVNIENSAIGSKRTIIEGYYLISDFVVSPDNRGIFFTAIKEKFSASQVYYYEFLTTQISIFTPGYKEDSHDYRLAISPNGQNLAVTTVMGDVAEQKITIYHITNRSIVKRFFHDQAFYSIAWSSDNSLVFLDKHNISEINIDSGGKETLITNVNGELISLELTKLKNFLVLKQSSFESLLIEVQLPSFEFLSQKLVLGENNKIKEALFQGKTKLKFLTETNGESNSFLSKNEDGSFRDTLLKTTLDIDIYDSSLDGEFLLLKLDGLLALFNTKTYEIDYITGGSQYVFNDAAFSKNQKYILYGEKMRSGWVVRQYDIEDKTKVELFEGYKSARQLSNGYIILGTLDKLHFVADPENIPVSLGIEVVIDFNTRWFAIDNNIYWSTFDGVSSSFNIFNLDTRTTYVKSFNAAQISSKFHVNFDGTIALLHGNRLPEIDVVKIMAKH